MEDYENWKERLFKDYMPYEYAGVTWIIRWVCGCQKL
jgi:hypothetical protein